MVNVRLRQSSLDQIDVIARDKDWTRSQVLRQLFALGLKAWNKGER